MVVEPDDVASLRAELVCERERREAAEREVAFANAFAALLGHDLRNPLNTIAMGATMLARAGGGGEVTRTAQRIATSSDRMARMIDQLMELTRIRMAGGLTLERARVDIAEVCAHVVDAIELGPLRIPIAMSTTGHTFGLWDRGRLLQVFANLIGNAVSHGTRDGRIEVDVDGADGTHVVVTVRNDGAVDPAVIPALFDAVRGASHAKAQARGLGLGLHITQQIVRAHGGQIAVASDAATGTEFAVELPRLPVTA